MSGRSLAGELCVELFLELLGDSPEVLRVPPGKYRGIETSWEARSLLLPHIEVEVDVLRGTERGFESTPIRASVEIPSPSVGAKDVVADILVSGHSSDNF